MLSGVGNVMAVREIARRAVRTGQGHPVPLVNALLLMTERRVLRGRALP